MGKQTHIARGASSHTSLSKFLRDNWQCKAVTTLCVEISNQMTPLGTLAISVLFMVITSAIASFCRKLVKKSVASEFGQELLNEAIASAELCAVCFELAIIADNYGIQAYAIGLFLFTIWWSYEWQDATACTYTHIEDIVKGTTNVQNAVMKMAAQIVGGCLVFKYVQFVWNLELSELHAGKADADCTADLQVSALYGAFIEGIATCVCRISSNALADNLTTTLGKIIDAFISTTMVVAAFNYSGGYFNPVLATGLKWGCDGHTFGEFMTVYWLGSILGSLAHLYIYKLPIVQNIVYNKEKDE